MAGLTLTVSGGYCHNSRASWELTATIGHHSNYWHGAAALRRDGWQHRASSARPLTRAENDPDYFPLSPDVLWPHFVLV